MGKRLRGVGLEEDRRTVRGFFGLEEDKKTVRDAGLKRDNSTFRVEGGLVLRLRRLAVRLRYREDTKQSCNKCSLLFFQNKYYSILV
jgi:hypothetical protein